MYAASDLSVAAYCPRQLYYRRDDDCEVPPSVAARRELAFEYERLLAADDASLSARPRSIGRTSGALGSASTAGTRSSTRPIGTASSQAGSGEGSRARSSTTRSPPRISARIATRAGRLETPLRAIALAKALSWEHEVAVETAFVKYPTHGIVREIALTTRRKAAYRDAVVPSRQWTARRRD